MSDPDAATLRERFPGACGSCRYFFVPWGWDEDDPGDTLGDCTYEPVLPLVWRWARREVTATSANEAGVRDDGTVVSCPCHAVKEDLA